MTAAKDQSLPEEETGYGAAQEGDLREAPDQVQPDIRKPAEPEVADQDNYANTDHEAS